jgi:hypothetical protein
MLSTKKPRKLNVDMHFVLVIRNAFVYRMFLLESVLHLVYALEHGQYTMKLKICNGYNYMSVELLFQSMQH